MTDYNAMSLDELLREEKKQYASYHGEGSLHITFVICERRAARDAILDLAEQLDAEGLITVREEDWKNALFNWTCYDSWGYRQTELAKSKPYDFCPSWLPPYRTWHSEGV